MSRLNKKVAIGLSGGVDSSVAAYLLQKQGYDVIGITMQLCEEVEAQKDAEKVAKRLNIPHYFVDLKNEFKKYVISDFAEEYLKGRTPNPCAVCNKYIKFGAMIEAAKSLGAEHIATGHYAKIEKHKDRYVIVAAKDSNKDQTYMLYSLSQDVLKRVLFPCGDYTKSQIREVAKEIGLEVHDKKESMDICFIPNNNHGEYIKKLQLQKPITQGNFINKDGKVLGTHKGIIYYTIGQRKGLGISLGEPAYVIDIIPEKNQVILGKEEDIINNSLIAKDVNFIPFDSLQNKMKVQAKIRYSSSKSDAYITPLDKGLVKVNFVEKQRAITKGQRVVFYIDDLLVGGGVIESIND